MGIQVKMVNLENTQYVVGSGQGKDRLLVKVFLMNQHMSWNQSSLSSKSNKAWKLVVNVIKASTERVGRNECWREFYIIYYSLVDSLRKVFYNYIDPCEQTQVRSTYTLNQQEQGFLVTYYNQSRFFTLDEVLGELEIWRRCL